MTSLSQPFAGPAAKSGTFKIGGDLAVHRLGFGAMQLTGAGVWGEPADHDETIAVLRRAVELDINLIDTADSYGTNGLKTAAPSISARRAKAAFAACGWSGSNSFNSTVSIRRWGSKIKSGRSSSCSDKGKSIMSDSRKSTSSK
jgi:hypothetical protein